MTGERIPNGDLIVGGVYLVHARNFSVAVFTGRGFLGPREKFGDEYLFEECLQEMPGEPYTTLGTAYGIRLLALPADRVDENDPKFVAALFAAQLLYVDGWRLRNAIADAGLDVTETGDGDLTLVPAAPVETVPLAALFPQPPDVPVPDPLPDVQQGGRRTVLAWDMVVDTFEFGVVEYRWHTRHGVWYTNVVG